MLTFQDALKALYNGECAKLAYSGSGGYLILTRDSGAVGGYGLVWEGTMEPFNNAYMMLQKKWILIYTPTLHTYQVYPSYCSHGSMYA